MTHHPLPTRLREVLQLLNQGLRNTDIAHAMGVSPKTVGTYKRRLVDKGVYTPVWRTLATVAAVDRVGR